MLGSIILAHSHSLFLRDGNGYPFSGRTRSASIEELVGEKMSRLQRQSLMGCLLAISFIWGNATHSLCRSDQAAAQSINQNHKHDKIIFTCPTGIYTINAQGRNLKRVSKFKGSSPPVSFSPDGQQLVYSNNSLLSEMTAHGKKEIVGPSATGIFLVNIDGSNLCHFIKDDWGKKSKDGEKFTGPSYFADYPRFTPDGKHILFVENTDDGFRHQKSHLAIIDIKTRKIHYVTEITKGEIVNAPALSPDQTKIVYSLSPSPSSYDNSIFGLYTINADGTGQHRITKIRNHGYDRDPVWSPDGCKIAFVSTRDMPPFSDVIGITNIYAVNANGSNEKRLTKSSYSNETPTWSPDGKMIAWVSNRTGDNRIWVMDADGNRQKLLTKALFGRGNLYWM